MTATHEAGSPAAGWDVFDAHAHFFGHSFFKALANMRPGRAEIGDDEVAPLVESLGLEPPPADPAEMGARWVHELNRRGVNRTVLFTSAPGDHVAVAAACGAHPDRLFGTVMVNPRMEGAEAVAEKALGELGLCGITLFPAMHGYGADDAITEPIYRAAQRHSVPVLVHCGVLEVKVRQRLGIADNFDRRFSNPMALSKPAVQFPDVNFIIPHFGAGFLREALLLGAQCPNIHLDTSSSNSWMTLLPYPLDLRTVFQKALYALGPERILFGTDSSVFPRGWRFDIFCQQREVLSDLGLSRSEQGRILGGNIARLLGLHAS